MQEVKELSRSFLRGKSIACHFSLFCCFIILLAAMVFSAAVSAQGPPDPNQPDMSIDVKARAETIDSLAKCLREAYVFPDVGGKVAKMLEERKARGEYNSVTSAKEFSGLLTKQMSEVAHDKHLRVFYSSKVLPLVPAGRAGEEPQPDPETLQRMQLQLKKNNYAFEKVERLSGNVGYLKFNAFTDAERGGETVAGAMAFLANTDALIIDLRENHGGNPGMVALLASYFFSGDEPVHVNDLSFRKEGTTEYSVTQWWTLPYVPGKRYVDKEVYILTSRGTFSAAEEFTYDLQSLKRATLVGETTGGGANPGGITRLADHFQAFIPRGHAINPVTKTNWEGVGIKPDIEVPQENALSTAHKTAVQHLIAKTTAEQELKALKQTLASLEAAQGKQQPEQPSTAAASAGDVTGVWKGQITDPDGNPHELAFHVKADGSKITGTITGGPPNGAQQSIENGKVAGDNISFEISTEAPDGSTIKLVYSGQVKGTQMQGSLSSPMGRLLFTLTKQ